MKAERLLALLTILLSGKRVSARWLSEELEVSERTVYRDVEALSEAGFPVYATTGRDGGFSLIDGFRMTGQLFSTGEIQRIISALDGLSGVCPQTELESLKRKFTLLLTESGAKGIPCPSNRVFIELTPSNREKSVIDLLDESISASSVIRMTYCDVNGTETTRDIEPAALLFFWQSWFLYAWCRLRGAFRCFRIARIEAIEQTGLVRTGPVADLAERPWRKEWEKEEFEDIAFVIGREARGRIAEYFDRDAITEQEDGSLLVRGHFPTGEWVLSWIMGLPGTVSIISPPALRERMRARAAEIVEKNQQFS